MNEQEANKHPVDSNFLRATHSFKMDLIPALERTLQGNVKPCMLYPTYSECPSRDAESRP